MSDHPDALAAARLAIKHLGPQEEYLDGVGSSLLLVARAYERALAELTLVQEAGDRADKRLRQETQRRESLQRRHANLVEHVKIEHGARQRLEKRLDALLWVWCSGGCASGVLRWLVPEDQQWWRQRGEVTEEIVALAESNTKRLRGWFESNRRRPHPASSQEGVPCH